MIIFEFRITDIAELSVAPPAIRNPIISNGEGYAGTLTCMSAIAKYDPSRTEVIAPIRFLIL